MVQMCQILFNSYDIIKCISHIYSDGTNRYILFSHHSTKVLFLIIYFLSIRPAIEYIKSLLFWNPFNLKGREIKGVYSIA